MSPALLRAAAAAGLAGWFGVALFGLAGVAAHAGLLPPPPDQPIAFSHRVHVHEKRLPCDACHVHAGTSPSAGIPSVERCLSCHRAVATDRPEVRKILRARADSEPIAWVRVHTLPDHVFFTHERHVRALGPDACRLCHGEVEAMEAARRVRSLEMGMCVACHRAAGAPLECLTCHK